MSFPAPREDEANHRADLLAEYRALQMLLTVTEPDLLRHYRDLQKLLGWEEPTTAIPDKPPLNRPGRPRRHKNVDEMVSDGPEPEKRLSGPKNSPGGDVFPIPY